MWQSRLAVPSWYSRSRCNPRSGHDVTCPDINWDFPAAHSLEAAMWLRTAAWLTNRSQVITSTCSISKILSCKQEEILNKFLCAQRVKHSAFHATSLFSIQKMLFRLQWLKKVNLKRLFQVFASESVWVFGWAQPDPDALHLIHQRSS